GNHDQAAADLVAARGFNPRARRAITWTREQLAAPVPDGEAAGRRLRFLDDLPLVHLQDGAMFAHGSPSDFVNEYVMPDDVYASRKMRRLFAAFEGRCFVGHTHIPGVFTTDERSASFEFHAPEPYQFGEAKALVNVGSVGQPRDGDWRACYCLLTGDIVAF